MVQRWPGVFIPSIPEKQKIGNLKKNFIDERVKLLDQFVKKIAMVKSLYFSDEFRLFLKNDNDGFEKQLNQLPKQTYSDLISKFQYAFPQLAGTEINSELELKITQFNQYLKKVKPMLKVSIFIESRISKPWLKIFQQAK